MIWIDDKLIDDEVTAGENLSDGDTVYISASNTVKKVTSNTAAIYGVVNGSYSSGNTAQVVVFGRKTVTADGAISAGDRVVGATTAGRVVTGGIPLTGKGGAVTNDVGEDGSHGLETGAASDTYVDTDFTVGKAIGSASGAGDSLTIFVC